MNDTTRTSGSNSPESIAVRVNGLHKGFWMESNRMLTVKERVLNPRSSSKRRFEVLEGIDLAIERGEFFGIVGRNGSGKSTLLKCLAGIYTPDSGEVEINGRLATFIELGVGFNPDLAAMDNVVLNATLMGLSMNDARDRFERIIEFAELQDFAGLKLRNYSSGMLVRLAFAVAINVDADVLVFDEVLAVGDLAFQNKCFDVFDAIKHSEKTVIFVTHSMDLVHRFCDRAIMIENGKITASGNTSDVALRYERANYDKDEPMEQTDESSRSIGDGSAKILPPRLLDATGHEIEECVQGDEIEVTFEIRIERELVDPIIGVTFLDENHASVFATNTESDRLPTRTYRAGESVTFSVRFTALFERGTYFVCPAIAHRGGSPFADFIDRACSIHVKSNRTRWGVANFPHRTTVQ